MSLLERVKPGISRRVDFVLQRNKCALLIIDVQKFLTYPDYEYYNQTSLPRALQNIEKLATQFRAVRDTPNTTHGCEVIVTYVQSSTKDGREISLDYKLSGPLLANIPRVGDTDIFLPEFAPDPHSGKGDILLPKTSCSVFQSTNLHYLLRNLGIEQIVVCGQLTDECVESAVRDGADLGYFMTVPEDACAAITLERHKIGLQGMHGFCRILKTSHIIWEIAESNEVSLLRRDNISLEAITTFLKGRGFSDAAIEVASQFSGNGSNGKHPNSSSSPRGQYHTMQKTISNSHLTDGGSTEDVVTVSSAVADNIQQRQQPKTSKSPRKQQPSNTISPNATSGSPSRFDDEITPTRKNGMTTEMALQSFNKNSKGRDPSELKTPDLNHHQQQRNSMTNMTSTQYNNQYGKKISNSSNNNSNHLRHSTGKLSVSPTKLTSKERVQSYTGPIDLDDDGVTVLRVATQSAGNKYDPPDSKELLEL